MWRFLLILLRLAANVIIAQQGAVAASRGGAWWALAIVLEVFALVFLVLNVAIVWAWFGELRGAEGHS